MAENESLSLGPIPPVPFAEIRGNPPSEPDIASFAKWLKIDREVRHRIHRKPKFFLVQFRDNKFENGVLVESGIGCLTDPSKAESCTLNHYKNTEGHIVRWEVHGYCIDPPDLPKLIDVCNAHPLHFAGIYDKSTEHPIGYDYREETVKGGPRLNNETGTQMSEQLKEVFFGPPPRFTPKILGGHRVMWKEAGALDENANFWAIQIGIWPTWPRYHDEEDPFNEFICFENNWICTTNREEVKKWFRNGSCRGEGAAEFEFLTEEEFLGFLKECEPWFGKLKVMRTFEEPGGPIEGVAVYSENFGKEHNLLAHNSMEYGGRWESKGTGISLQQLERELEERSGIPKGKSRRG